jgi:hypothetical protein
MATEVAQNVKEFSEIAGLILAKLYPSFPRPCDLDRNEIAKALGLISDTSTLPSGAVFRDVFVHTLGWLIREGFIYSHGTLPAERDVLTTRGLAAMNAVPATLKQPVGSELARVANDPPSEDRTRKFAGMIGELIGSVAGSFAKSMSSG